MHTFTQEQLREWAGEDVFRRAMDLVNQDRVRDVKSHPRRLEGFVEARPRDIRCAVAFPAASGLPENQCPCRDSREMGVFCHHATALCLKQLEIQSDPVRLERLKMERRRAERIESHGEEDYLQRVPAGTPGSIAVHLYLRFPGDLRSLWDRQPVPLQVMIEHKGRRELIHQVRNDLKVSLPQKHDNLLYVLEDIAGGPVPDELELSPGDLANVLELSKGMEIGSGDHAMMVSDEPLETGVRLEFDDETGCLILDLEARLPDGLEQGLPSYWSGGRGAWAAVEDWLFPVTPLLPEPLHGLYREPMVIPRPDVPRFLRVELGLLQKLVTLRTDVDPDWFSLEPARPGFRLEVRGSPASLSATLYAVYENTEWVAGAGETPEDFVQPDPENLLHYRTRNPEAEELALDSLRTLGFGGERGDRMEGLVGTSAVLTFCASGIPRLRRRGWKVELTGRIAEALEEADTLVPVVNVQPGSGGWFDVEASFETTEGESLQLDEVRQALLAGDAFVQRNGKTWLFDRDATAQMFEVFSECGDGDVDGPVRLDSVHGAYLQSTLAGLDGVDIDAPREWMAQVEKWNSPAKLEPVKPSPELKADLRPYQQEGLNWLCFLEKAGFAGILADEMGLGKTLQTLAWLQLRKVRAEGAPALIICPTSLVENWIEEGERFTPDLRFVNLTGTSAKRDKVFEKEAEDADVWVTSYAVIQRDLARYLKQPVSSLVLDEAQHIKNPKTLNAKAVKKVHAASRLVLTGTPVENSVTDLWSIMDFLMPGYLTTHALFKQRFEAPIRAGGAEAQEAQARLRKKLQPFLLRRLKKDVAKDLPPKIEKVAFCRMTKDQAMVYKEIAQRSKESLEASVAANGFAKSRMEVLKTLLRLRQASCHLDLLKMPGLKSKAPSGKLEYFREMLDEAIDGGHRVLVFSQFTSMLAILREELEKQDLSYCYLDGSTRNRMDQVRRFQGDESIPVFLISLKAGGTGLNLTGADTVIHFDPWWNPAVENQATDRAYRIGQQNKVYSMKLITRDTVEEKVLELQRRKQQVIDATLESDEALVKSLDWDDVQDLLSL
jgi:superfamily II DNA or RNA helicase